LKGKEFHKYLSVKLSEFQNSAEPLLLVLQVTDIERYFSEQVGADLPVAIAEELSALRQRLLNM
jgi:hypothetical protein